MNGLEAILNRIMQDAEEQICDIGEQADARCAEILAAADREAAAIVRGFGLKAAEQAAILQHRSDSLSALETRKTILAARQALIDEVIKQAAARLARLPRLEKAALYRRFLEEQAAGSESVVFAGEDQPIAGQIVAAANREKGWHLTVDPTPGNFSGGLILRQDLIETNLTIDLLVRSLRPELVGLAAAALFCE